MTGFDGLGNIICTSTPVVIVSDDFETGRFFRPPWDVVSFGSNIFNVSWGIVFDGSQAVQGEGGVSTGGGNSVAYRTDFSAQDFAVEAKVKVHEVRNGGHHSGIVARFRDQDNFYEFYLNKFSNHLLLGVWVGGVFQRLDEGGVSLPPEWFDTWITLKLELQGDRLQAFANGELFFDVRDSSHTNGSAGLFNAGGSTRFDDFKVEAR